MTAQTRLVMAETDAADWVPSIPEYTAAGCTACVHWQDCSLLCDAYPDSSGIPMLIASGQIDHLVPRPGQVPGVLFEEIAEGAAWPNVERAYSPSQPRVPAGSSAGGEFAGADAADASSAPSESYDTAAVIKASGMTIAQYKAVHVAEDALRLHRDHEELRIINKNGRTVFHAKGGSDTVDLSDAHIARMRGQVVTHNHPRGWNEPENYWSGADGDADRQLLPNPVRLGNSFSPGDLFVASKGGAAEIRAVSVGYRHSMRPPRAYRNSSGENTFTEAMYRESIEPSYLKHYGDVRADNYRAINAGTLSTREAEGNHYHEVWTRVARETGLRYSREPYTQSEWS